MATRATKRSVNKISKKQLMLRNSLWPDIDESKLWIRTENDGFTTIPRTMPIIMAIMDVQSKGKPLSSTYLELWCRVYDECFVTLNNSQELAFHSGFGRQRGVTTWKGRMRLLHELGFIDIKPGPSGEFSYALLLNPYLIIKDMYQKKTPGLTEELYNALVARAISIGADDLAYERPET